MSMNMSRFTISMPVYLYQQVKSRSTRTSVSQFITQAVEDAVVKIRHQVASDPIADFIQLENQLPKISKIDILKAIDRGRE